MGIKILAVNGSMRDNSRTGLALQKILDAAQESGAQTHLLHLRELDLPMFRPEGSDASSVREALQRVQWADAFVLGSPDYHGSMSGALKNFLDFHWGEFAGKVFGYLCNSHEKGLTAMDQMRTAVRQCYGWSLPYGVSFSGDDVFGQDNSVTNAAFDARLKMLARDLTVYGTLIRQQFSADLQSHQSDTFAARYHPRS